MSNQIHVDCQKDCLMCKVIPIQKSEWSDLRSLLKNSATKEHRQLAQDVLHGHIVKVACEKRQKVIWVRLV